MTSSAETRATLTYSGLPLATCNNARYHTNILHALYARMAYMLETYSTFQIMELNIEFKPCSACYSSPHTANIDRAAGLVGKYLRRNGVESHYIWVKDESMLPLVDCYTLVVMMDYRTIDEGLSDIYDSATRIIEREVGKVSVCGATSQCDDGYIGSRDGCWVFTSERRNSCSDFGSVFAEFAEMARIGMAYDVFGQEKEFGCSPM